MTEPVSADLIALAARCADAAGTAIRPYFRASVAVDTKKDDTPVTEADRAAEAAIREILEAEVPEHGIFGEEFGTVRADAEYLWVLDPIDGTKSFICGVPLFGTLIALLHKGRPVLGLIDQPVLRERWIGAAGHPAELNGEAIATRSCADLAKARLFTTSPDMFAGARWERYSALRERVAIARYGTDCYAAGLLAAGHIDLLVEGSLEPYDYCALVPVIEAAGGVVTDWEGNPATLDIDGHIVAAGDLQVHQAALAILSGN
jgi:inositol-phosphate phosphatase/L-galactose 1-phosphate phosphatase/histidinol-phosphatase